MEIYPSAGEHAYRPEKYPIERGLKRALKRSLKTVDNVLVALTHTGEEGLVRDKRIEEIEKLEQSVFEHIEYRNSGSASGLISALTRLMQAQKVVIDTHYAGMQEIAIAEIIDALDEIEGSSFNYHLALPVANAFSIQHQTIEQLRLLDSVLLGADEPITRRIINIKTGVETAFTQHSIAPIRFIERSLETLIDDAKAVDGQMTNMPEKNEAWKDVQAENDKLRQLLTQFK